MKQRTFRNLVPLNREVVFDDTFREIFMALRFDAKIDKDENWVTQLLLDARHKKTMRLSKPKYYLSLSTPRQYEDLLTATFAMACANRLQNTGVINREKILETFDEIVSFVRPDICALVARLFKDIQVTIVRNKDGMK